MCFTPTISLSFAIIGVAATAYVVMYEPRLAATYVPVLIMFYTLMELLQTVQYSYVNQCDHPVNRALTNVAYIFVIVQPLLWNLFFYINSNRTEKKTFAAAIAMISIWMAVNIAERLMYNKMPQHFPPKTYNESVYGTDKTCTKRNMSHLYWTWTSASFRDLSATYLPYMILWVVPALLVPRHRPMGLLIIASAAIGAYITYKSGEPYIFASAWCFISAPTAIAAAIYLLYSS